MDSPVKIPAPTNSHGKSSTTIVKQEPKIEAWTSKFIKSTVTSNSDTSRIRPIVEVPPIVDDAQGINPTTLLAASPRTKEKFIYSEEKLAKVAESATPASIPIAIAPVSTPPLIEFVPPSTVTRRAVRNKDPIPREYIESPLTRAKRIDVQNTWRETQLKNFLAAKAEHARAALSSLRTDATDKVARQDEESPFTVLKSPSAVLEPSSTVAEPPSTVLEPSPAHNFAMEEPETGMGMLMFQSEELASLMISEEQMPKFDDLAFDFDTIPPPSITTPLVIGEEGIIETIKEDSSGQSPSDTLSLMEKLPVLDPLELERRKRLRDRNEKAVEKKKQLLQKAQQLRSQTIANLSGKPKEISTRRGQIVNVPSNTRQPIPTNLQKQAVINNAFQT